jgi:hypothetical protein
MNDLSCILHIIICLLTHLFSRVYCCEDNKFVCLHICGKLCLVVVELEWAATYSTVAISLFSCRWSLDRAIAAIGVKVEATAARQRQDRGN